MDGKLLILCDELPRDYEHHSVKDVYFLRSTMIDPDDDPERLFVTWDAVIPKDRNLSKNVINMLLLIKKCLLIFV